MGMFGWDYPPGCSSVPDDEDCICEVCGGSEDTCICPECPECGDIGNLDCYTKHLHMTLNDEQKEMIRQNEVLYKEQCRLDAEYEADYLRNNIL